MYNSERYIPCPFVGLLRRVGRKWGQLVAMVAAIFATGMLVVGCVNDDDDSSRALSAGDKCPIFEVTLSDGRVVSTSDLAGRLTMIVFFNTECEDCRRELPVIQRVADALAAQSASGLQGQHAEADEVPRVICVSRAEGEASVAAYWAANGFSLPYSAQTDAKVYRLFAESVIPRIYIIGADLSIVAAYAERLPAEGTLLELMR